MASGNNGANGQQVSLSTFFGPVPMNSGSQSSSAPTQPNNFGANGLFSFASGTSNPNAFGGWQGGPNFGSDGSAPAAAPTSPYAVPPSFNGGYGGAPLNRLSVGPPPKGSLDLFNSVGLPPTSGGPPGLSSSLPVYGPTSVGSPVHHDTSSLTMPPLPPAPTNVLPLTTSDSDSSRLVNNIHLPHTDPSDLRTRLLALSPSPSPAECTNLKIVRPAELPQSDYRRDSMAGNRYTFAYVTNLRNVGPTIRVWRRSDSAASTPNPFMNASSLSLKEHVGNSTDIHLSPSLSSDETLIAVGDSAGNVSIHHLPPTSSSGTSTPTKTTTDTKTCILRIVPIPASPLVQVLRVFWHPILPRVLAIAYSDGVVSVWNITYALQAEPQNADLLVGTASPLTYTRVLSSRLPLVVSASHGSETISDVVMWGNTIFTSSVSGSVFMHDLATGAIQRVFRAHQHGVGALVLATCPSVESGYMPIFISTSADGSELKLWRHASPRADWTCLQALTLPTQTTPYFISRYSFNNTFIIYNPAVGTAWELKLFEEEMALLPGNYFSDLRCHSLLLMANFDVLFKYSKEDIAILTYPKSSFPQVEMTTTQVSDTAIAATPSYAATAPNPHSHPAPGKAVQYHQHMREASQTLTPSSVTQTQIPPSRLTPDVLPTLPPRSTPPVAQPSGPLFTNPGTMPSRPAPSQSNAVVPHSAPTLSSTSSTASASSVQAILSEASRNLGEMIRSEEEQWKVEDKKFLLKVNEAMRHIPTVVAQGIQMELSRLPTSSVDVPELAKALANAVAAPIGLAFKEQFGDVLVPGMEDATSKMLKNVDAKMKSVAATHAQSVAVNDVARSVEPLVASLLLATTEMTKSLQSLPSSAAAHHAQVPQASASQGSASKQSDALVFPTASASSSAGTPSKHRPRSGSIGANGNASKQQQQQHANPKPASTPSATTAAPAPSASTTKSNKKEKTPTTVKSAKTEVAPTAANAPARKEPVSFPSWAWLFALSHGIHL